MKVCGFTFIKNAEKYDFPVAESIQSILPICDLFVVAVGNSTDATREIVQNISEKIRIIDTVWNENLVKGGAVYADETNKAFDAVPNNFDWCFYIQGDEVVHEKYLQPIKTAMLKNLDNQNVEGLLFNYRHFYGTFDYVGDCRHWYRKEIRIIRNNKNIRSYRDAQGFRLNNRKLYVVELNAEIYHYGWVRHPRFMMDKIMAVKVYYDGISEQEANKKAGDEIFNYSAEYDALAKFDGSHPAVMIERIKKLNWNIEVDLKKINMKFKYRLLYKIEKWFGVRLFEYKNYKRLKTS